jgi:hypothetical protein
VRYYVGLGSNEGFQVRIAKSETPIAQPEDDAAVKYLVKKACVNGKLYSDIGDDDLWFAAL